MSLITNTQELEQICTRLAKHSFITIDTEFLRETTFWPQLCVIQLASSEEAVAIDALAPGLDLAAFFALMQNEAVTKVFHAARQDIEIIWHLARIIPTPLFDTQVAAMVCGFGDQVSYGELVQTLCHVQLDKSSRFTDWTKRPLSRMQIDYAIADVTHLREVYQILRARLEREERLDWVDSEMAVLKAPATYEQHPDRAWEKLRNRARKPRDLALIMELAAWREREAQARDVPRSRVLKDDILVEIAYAAPQNLEALMQLRYVARGFDKSSFAQGVVDAVQRGLTIDMKTLPKLERRKGNKNTGAIIELLKVLLRHVADQNNVAVRMLATSDELDAIALDDEADVPALTGWRHKIFGQYALDLKHGRLALGVEGGKVVLIARGGDDKASLSETDKLGRKKLV